MHAYLSVKNIGNKFQFTLIYKKFPDGVASVE